jgi:hypothetical protein
MMRPDSISKASTEIDNLSMMDFIGPQLPVDWTSPDQAYQRFKTANAVLDMNKLKGRDEIKVHRKGEFVLRRFNATVSELPKEAMGPGYYDLQDWRRIGSEAKGIIPFSKHIGRDDLNNEDANFESQDRLLDLDIDAAYSALKGEKNKGTELYREDRFNDSNAADDGNDHIGGTWFKGMAEEVKSKAAVINFDKMSGREDSSKFVEDNDYNLGVDGGRLILNTDLGQKHVKPKSDILVAWKDPEEQPRFVEVKNGDIDRPVLSPKKVFSKVPMHVDMSKQLGRSTGLDEQAILHEEIHGTFDADLIREAAKEKDSAIHKAKAGKSTKKGIDIEAQLGRTEICSSNTQHLEYDISAALEAVKPSKGKYTTDWGKVQGRSVSDQVEELSREELDLLPNVAVQSNFKKAQSASNWSLQKQSKFDTTKVPESAGLAYEYDPDVLRKPKEAKAPHHMQSHLGRVTREDELRLLDNYIEVPEQLVIAPSDHATQRKPSGAGASWSKAERPTSNTANKQNTSLKSEKKMKGKKEDESKSPDEEIKQLSSKIESNLSVSKAATKSVSFSVDNINLDTSRVVSMKSIPFTPPNINAPSPTARAPSSPPGASPYAEDWNKLNSSS